MSFLAEVLISQVDTDISAVLLFTSMGIYEIIIISIKTNSIESNKPLFKADSQIMHDLLVKNKLGCLLTTLFRISY